MCSDMLYVGAPGSNSNVGSVFAFKHTEGMFVLVAQLTASDGHVNDLFGELFHFIHQ